MVNHRGGEIGRCVKNGSYSVRVEYCNILKTSAMTLPVTAQMTRQWEYKGVDGLLFSCLEMRIKTCVRKSKTLKFYSNHRFQITDAQRYSANIYLHRVNIQLNFNSNNFNENRFFWTQIGIPKNSNEYFWLLSWLPIFPISASKRRLMWMQVFNLNFCIVYCWIECISGSKLDLNVTIPFNELSVMF